MKPLLTLILILVAAGTATAQYGPPNSMGLSSNQAWLDQCVYGPSMTIYTLDLFVHDPVNPDFDGTGTERPVAFVNGFECRIWTEGDATILDVRFPVDAVDAGTGDTYIVGFAEPVPVVDSRAVVATVDVFLWTPGTNPVPTRLEDKASPLPCDNYHALIRMAPTRTTPSVPERMAFLDADDPDDPLVGAVGYMNWGGGDDEIQMLLEAMIVDTEDHSWGELKALYR